MSRLTLGQRIALAELRKACTVESGRYASSSPKLWLENQKRLAEGDEHSVYAMGVITSQVGCALGVPASSVLSTFKALERKGLVIRDKKSTSAVKFWWPVGLAAELAVKEMVSA